MGTGASACAGLRKPPDEGYRTDGDAELSVERPLGCVSLRTEVVNASPSDARDVVDGRYRRQDRRIGALQSIAVLQPPTKRLGPATANTYKIVFRSHISSFAAIWNSLIHLKKESFRDSISS